LASISCNPFAIWLNTVLLKHGLNTKGRQAASLRRMGAELGGGGSQNPEPD